MPLYPLFTSLSVFPSRSVCQIYNLTQFSQFANYLLSCMFHWFFLVRFLLFVSICLLALVAVPIGYFRNILAEFVFVPCTVCVHVLLNLYALHINDSSMRKAHNNRWITKNPIEYSKCASMPYGHGHTQPRVERVRGACELEQTFQTRHTHTKRGKYQTSNERPTTTKK